MFKRKKITFVVAAALLAVAGATGTAGALGDSSRYPSETVFDEQFSVEPGGLLEVQVGDMDVDITAGAKDRASVKVVVSGPDLDKAIEYYEKMRFSAQASHNKLYVETDTRRRSWIQFDWNKYRRVNVKVFITVPSEFDADVRTSDGDVRAEGLEGKIALKTSDGDVDASDLSGSRLQMVTSDGDVVARDMGSKKVWIKTSDGDLIVENVRSDEVGMSTSDGDVRVEGVEAKTVSMSSSDGDITVRELKAGFIEIRTSDGDVDAAASGDELNIRTSDGDISVKIDGKMAVTLVTSDGNITLAGPSDLRADLNLKGDRVRILGGLNLDGEVGTRRIIGKLNNGGPKIQARASDGTIALDLR